MTSLNCIEYTDQITRISANFTFEQLHVYVFSYELVKILILNNDICKVLVSMLHFKKSQENRKTGHNLLC